jgi:succinate dehydrogenase / fumarate reductase, iron-sulfur subunit
MAEELLNFNLHVWRQAKADKKVNGSLQSGGGKMVVYPMKDISTDMSFLEMLDILNEDLLRKGEDPVAFDHDCREGICGMCSLYINGHPHGPEQTTTCQLHMRSFRGVKDIYVEPWRAKAFPVLKDLVVDRGAFDRIIQAGGFISVNTGVNVDANEIPIPKQIADTAMDAATCIGCGACVAACKNASAMLFVSAKVSQLALLPQGHAERKTRVEKMVAQMDAEGFGSCTNTGACEAECPKEISLTNIARMNREYVFAKLTSDNV